MSQPNRAKEYDFALVIEGVSELNSEIEDALFKAGCDDATFSIQHGKLYAEFSRASSSLMKAIMVAIADVQGAGIGASVICIDQCDLVSQAEIARRIERSRQQVFQYINGQRGPGDFPPPECYLAENAPLWRWCEVSRWLVKNDVIPAEESEHAEVVAAINTHLEVLRQQRTNPKLAKEVSRLVGSVCK